MKKARKEEEPLRKKEAKWDWRKRYRVWDANRKIFVYPENWIEPDVAMFVRMRSSSFQVPSAQTTSFFGMA